MSLRDEFSVLGKLSTITRYSQTRLINEESVLEHIGFVCLLTTFMIQHDASNIDGSSISMKAAVHDMDEIITGDIPRPTKYWNKGVREALSEIEHFNMKKISNQLFSDNRLLYLWKDSKEGASGEYVDLADKLAVLYKIRQEVLIHGNKSLKGHATNVLDTLLKYSFEEGSVLNQYLVEAISMCEEVIIYE